MIHKTMEYSKYVLNGRIVDIQYTVKKQTFKEFPSFDDLILFNNSVERKTQLLLEKKITKRVKKHELKKLFSFIIARCDVCGKIRVFYVSSKYGTEEYINFREHVTCYHCRMSNRLRLMATILKQTLRKNDNIYIQERITDFYDWLATNYNNVTGSEYLEGYRSGQMADVPNMNLPYQVRHEDCLDYSFDDNTFDVIISQDVFEHVSNAEKAFFEAYRILNKNGKMIFTVPVMYNNDQTIQRAYLENGGGKKYITTGLSW